MPKQIIIDYNEYLDLVEKAKLAIDFDTHFHILGGSIQVENIVDDMEDLPDNAVNIRIYSDTIHKRIEDMAGYYKDINKIEICKEID